MKILLSGGTGFIGAPLRKTLLEEGHEIILLTRHPEKYSHESPRLEPVLWYGDQPPFMSQEFKNVEAVIHLAGEGIMDNRWTTKQKEKLVNSRVQSTKSLVEFVLKEKLPVKVWLNASAIGYYGASDHQTLDETSPAGNDFLAEIGKAWEDATAPISQSRADIRLVLLRTGFVLEKDGGALSKMVPPFRFFAGGPLGSGKQWLSWIHLKDEIAAISFCLHQNIYGPVNLTAPEPVTMKVFCQKLGETLHRPSWAQIPEFVLKFILGERAKAIISGQRVVPRKLEQTGFQFNYPRLDQALNAIFSQ